MKLSGQPGRAAGAGMTLAMERSSSYGRALSDDRHISSRVRVR